MPLEYEPIADLPVTVEHERRRQRRADTTSGFERVTTEVVLSGDGTTGAGEDVTYEAGAHAALADAGPVVPTGEFRFREFSAAVGAAELFPCREPDGPAARRYRRWAVESAGLELALAQNDVDLGTLLGREPEPVRFVVSTRLGDPPTADRVRSLLDHDPDLEFKLDPTPDWDAALVAELAATGTVRLLDLKGYYEGTAVDTPADPALYELVVDGFPDAVIEDAAVEPDTRALLEASADRLSFDYPVAGVDDLRDLPVAPRWLNVKPSRFGTVASLVETLAYCEREGITTYGGGQFELGVGRDQIQALAALTSPDAPNDVAPRAYNDPDATPDALPSSPLDPGGIDGFGIGDDPDSRGDPDGRDDPDDPGGSAGPAGGLSARR